MKIMKRIKFSVVFNIAVVFISFSLIIYFIFSKDGLKDLMYSAQGISLPWIVGALACHFGNEFIDSVLTWQFARQKYKKFSFLDGIKTAFTGHFFSAVTPGASGGQPMQVLCMDRLGVDVGFASSMLLQKFLVYQVVSVAYASILFLFHSQYILTSIKGSITIWFVVIGFLSQLFVMAFVLLASFEPKLIKRTMRVISPIIKKFKDPKSVDLFVRKVDIKVNVFYKSNKSFLKNPRLIIISVIEVALQITLIYAVPYFVYKGLVPQGDGAFVTMLCALSFVNIISSMIPIPGASGVSELAFSIFFGAFFTPTTLKSAILIWRVITYYLTIIIGAPFSILGKKRESVSSSKEMLKKRKDYF